MLQAEARAEECRRSLPHTLVVDSLAPATDALTRERDPDCESEPCFAVYSVPRLRSSADTAANRRPPTADRRAAADRRRPTSESAVSARTRTAASCRGETPWPGSAVDDAAGPPPCPRQRGQARRDAARTTRVPLPRMRRPRPTGDAAAETCAHTDAARNMQLLTPFLCTAFARPSADRRHVDLGNSAGPPPRTLPLPRTELGSCGSRTSVAVARNPVYRTALD